MDDFAGTMRALMAERGTGVRALARQVPCDHALVSRLSSGRQAPSAGMARRLDEILGAGGRPAPAPGPRPSSRGRGIPPPPPPAPRRPLPPLTPRRPPPTPPPGPPP